LESGTEFQPISMTLEDAEWIAARQFSVEEVARLFRVPPTVIGDLRHGNYSNSVEMARQFVTLTLRRHLVMWEQAVARCLLTEAGRRTYFAEHNVNGLLRGDSAAQSSFLTSMLDRGIFDIDEARSYLGMPPLPAEAGKLRLVPLNMQTVASATAGPPQPPAMQPAPEPAPVVEDSPADDVEDDLEAETPTEPTS
jgi:phage portal protein BeeE